MKQVKQVQQLVYRIGIAAAKLGVSRNTIYRLANAGKLTLVKIGPRSSGITAASIATHLGKGTNEE